MRTSSVVGVAAARLHLTVFGAAFTAAFMGFALPALAQQQDVAPSIGTVARLAGRLGVQNCLDATRRFGPALTGTTGSHSAVVMTHPAAPDAATMGVAIERNDAEATSLVSATFAPTLRGGCDLSYDKVDVWRKSCQDVAQEELRYTQALERLGERIAVIPYSPTHHVYLIRIAGGCVSVTKEVVYP
jgi:hypothetical protein